MQAAKVLVGIVALLDCVSLGATDKFVAFATVNSCESRMVMMFISTHGRHSSIIEADVKVEIFLSLSHQY